MWKWNCVCSVAGRGKRRFSFATVPQMSRFLPFEEARSYVRSIGLKSWEEWLTWCAKGQRPPNIPSNPRTFYFNQGKGWLGFADWLGYEKRTAVRRKRQRVMTKRNPPLLLSRQWDSAKEQFLKKLPENAFEFRALPHRSLAQLVFRLASSKDDDRLWCPLILRSAHQLRCDRIFFFDVPAFQQGAGMFFVLTSCERLFFFSHDFLAKCSAAAPTESHRPRRRMLQLRIDEIGECEILNANQMLEILKRYRRCASLLDEEDLNSCAMFSMPSDAERHTLMQQAVDFLRSDFNLKIERPSLRSFDAHFVCGEKNIVGRTCRCDTFYSRLQWCDRKGPGYPVRTKEGEDGADFVLGLFKHAGGDTATPRLRGFFIFPTSYLLALKYAREPAKKSPFGRSQMLIYPPWTTPKKADTRKRQDEQLNFFIDLSSASCADIAAAKAREILKALVV